MSNDTLDLVHDDAVDHARALLDLLFRTQPDPLERIVTACALAHLDAHDPPRRGVTPATSTSRGSRLHREVVEALTAVLHDHPGPAERARAALALQELADPLHVPADFEGDLR